MWRALSEQLEELRRAHVAGAKGSVEFLKRLLEVAREVVEAERADAEGRLDQFEVLDPDKGALTQILEDYAPPGVPVLVKNVVEEIDGHRAADTGDRLARESARRPRGQAPASVSSSGTTRSHRAATSTTRHTRTSASTTSEMAESILASGI